jgi:hypothetical protein
MQGEIDHDSVGALKQGRLHIHCFRMELTQSTSDKPRKYAGSGYIIQNIGGGIEFTIYAGTLSNIDAAADISSIMDAQPGTIIPKPEYYTLTAHSYSEYSWMAENIVNPFVDWRATVPRVSGDIRTLQRSPREAVTNSPYRMSMTFLEDIDFPCPLMSDRFVGADFVALEDKRFRIQKLDNELVIEITSSTPFPPYFDVRIIEALQFVLARSMSWRALVVTNNKEEFLQLAAQPRQSTRISLYRPLLANQIDEFPMFWRLFSKYLEYLTGKNNAPPWHSCSYYLHNASEASANSADAFTIELCVSVEKISGLVPYVEGSVEKEQKKRIQRTVCRWLKRKGWISSVVGQRATGLLSSLHHTRMRDRLADLMKTGMVDNEHLKRWGSLRHPGVHADDQNTGGVLSKDSQKWLDDIGAVTVLMYHLIFYLIGYNESYTDYSRRGWPSARYPLSSSERPTVSGTEVEDHQSA